MKLLLKFKQLFKQCPNELPDTCDRQDSFELPKYNGIYK